MDKKKITEDLKICAWEPAPIKEGVCGSCKHLAKNILSRRSYPAKYPCMKSARAHTEYDKCDVFPEQEESTSTEIDSKALGDNIKYWLDIRGMSQLRLADIVHSTPVTISRYISGTRVPSGPKLYQIARALGCTAEDLMQGVVHGEKKA